MLILGMTDRHDALEQLLADEGARRGRRRARGDTGGERAEGRGTGGARPPEGLPGGSVSDLERVVGLSETGASGSSIGWSVPASSSGARAGTRAHRRSRSRAADADAARILERRDGWRSRRCSSTDAGRTRRPRAPARAHRRGTRRRPRGALVSADCAIGTRAARPDARSTTRPGGVHVQRSARVAVPESRCGSDLRTRALRLRAARPGDAETFGLDARPSGSRRCRVRRLLAATVARSRSWREAAPRVAISPGLRCDRDGVIACAPSVPALALGIVVAARAGDGVPALRRSRRGARRACSAGGVLAAISSGTGWGVALAAPVARAWADWRAAWLIFAATALRSASWRACCCLARARDAARASAARRGGGSVPALTSAAGERVPGGTLGLRDWTSPEPSSPRRARRWPASSSSRSASRASGNVRRPHAGGRRGERSAAGACSQARSCS